MLEVKQVSRVVGKKTVLADVSFRLESGQTLAVVGPSGSGKSSLLRLIAGLDAPTTGEIRWRQRQLSLPQRVVVSPERRGFAMVFQDLALFPHLNVAGNVGFAISPASAPRDASEREKSLGEWLEIFSLSELRARKTHSLSGGEKQRVAMARSLASAADLLLLDEPFSGVDRLARHELIQKLKAILGPRKTTTVIVTHDARDALDFGASMMLLLDEGRLACFGSVDNVVKNPGSEKNTRFLQACLGHLPERAE